jgi:hypothetical protein
MINRIFAPAIALAALATAQTAYAQQQTCVAAADLSDAVVYTMPIAFDAAQTACTNRLTRNGFMASGGENFIADFRTRQNAAWPGALRLLKSFMADESRAGADIDMNAMIAALPEDSLRPFVDGMVGQMIVQEIKGDSCTKIERGLELISPLPTDNVGGLFAFIAELAELKSPTICGAAPAQAKK